MRVRDVILIASPLGFGLEASGLDELQGSLAERLGYARHVEDALLLAMDEAKDSDTAVVISYEPERERWSAAPVTVLAGRLSEAMG